jgi:hypothetical protein
VIASSTAAAAFLVIVIFAVLFYRTRAKRQHTTFIDAVTNKRKKEWGRAMLLHGEDLDIIDVPLERYHDEPRSRSSGVPSVSSLLNSPPVGIATKEKSGGQQRREFGLGFE